MAFNPSHFKKGQMVVSVYSGTDYEIIEPDKKGMAKLMELDTGLITVWNAHNNTHFNSMNTQLKLFSK
jgi:hypothetical protein